jgi:hypothetical protein
VIARFARFYGARPLHAVAVLGCLALAGHAALQTEVNPGWTRMAIWFAAALIGHDLLLFPLYAATDRLLVVSFGSGVNHVRVPLLGCALTFALFFPGIVGQGAPEYRAATGLDQSPYLSRWLLLCAALFAVSGLILIGRRAARALLDP